MDFMDCQFGTIFRLYHFSHQLSSIEIHLILQHYHNIQASLHAQVQVYSLISMHACSADSFPPLAWRSHKGSVSIVDPTLDHAPCTHAAEWTEAVWIQSFPNALHARPALRESNPRPLDLWSNALTARPHAPYIYIYLLSFVYKFITVLSSWSDVYIPIHITENAEM